MDAGAAGDSNLVPVVAMLGRVSCPRSASSNHVLIRGAPPHFYAPLLTVPSVRGTLDGVRCFPDPCNAPLGCEQDHQCVSWFPKCGGLSECSPVQHRSFCSPNTVIHSVDYHSDLLVRGWQNRLRTRSTWLYTPPPPSASFRRRMYRTDAQSPTPPVP